MGESCPGTLFVQDLPVYLKALRYCSLDTEMAKLVMRPNTAEKNQIQKKGGGNSPPSQIFYKKQTNKQLPTLINLPKLMCGWGD